MSTGNYVREDVKLHHSGKIIYSREKKVFICLMKSGNIPRNHRVHSNVSATCIRGASEKFLNDLKFLNLYLAYHKFNYP